MEIYILMCAMRFVMYMLCCVCEYGSFNQKIDCYIMAAFCYCYCHCCCWLNACLGICAIDRAYVCTTYVYTYLRECVCVCVLGGVKEIENQILHTQESDDGNTFTEFASVYICQ